MKMKNLLIEIEEMLMSGEYASDVAKRTGCSIETILQIEEDLYGRNEPRNIGADYDQQ